MRLGWGVVLGLLAFACGRSELFDDPSADGSASSSASSSSGSSSGGPARCALPAVDPEQLALCSPLDVGIATQQSCEIAQLDTATFHAEGFIDVADCKHRVLSATAFGAGQLVSYCDATTLGLLVNRFVLAGFVPGVGQRRIATLGDSILCAPSGPSGLAPDVSYLGEGLPAAYEGAPGALAADYDVVLLCGFRSSWSSSPIDTLARFANDFGGVVVTAMDYLATDEDLSNVNALAERGGARFLGASLAHRKLEVVACSP